MDGHDKGYALFLCQVQDQKIGGTTFFYSALFVCRRFGVVVILRKKNIKKSLTFVLLCVLLKTILKRGETKTKGTSCV